MIWMERERERGHPLHVARKRSDESLKAMNNHHAVVEGVKLASSPSMALTLEMAASLRGLLPSKQTSLAQHVNFLHEMGLPYDCRLTKRGKD